MGNHTQSPEAWVEIPHTDTKRLKVELPVSHPPKEVVHWLQNMGWIEQFGSGAGGTWKKEHRWDDMYYPWYEAVTLEHMEFMSLGNLGAKQVNFAEGQAETSRPEGNFGGEVSG